MSITAARGFLANGIHSGIKQTGLDLALIVSVCPATVAGVTTLNRMAAAPIHLIRETLARGTAQAIVANSGNANCCTGPAGLRDALAIRRETGKLLSKELKLSSKELKLSPKERKPLRIPEEAVLIASTGVIGQRLPTRQILNSLPALVQRVSRNGSAQASKAILTTDRVTKSKAVSFRIQGHRVTLGGIAKGSGMIEPAMATMLCFLTTDARISGGALRSALREANRKSFNAITIDGQMSTNDTVLLLANGTAQNRSLHPGQPGWNTFTEALEELTQTLAEAIVQDGEGATRTLTVRVQGARSPSEAAHVAKAMANAPLIKTMVRGEDPNWGRVAATLGATRIAFHPHRILMKLGGIPVFRNGAPVAVNRSRLKKKFRGSQVLIEVDLKQGRSEARVLTCDLSEGYVRINAKYS